MSPDIEPTIPRTVVCAVDREHGWVAEQAVPVPDGDAYTVVVAARAGPVVMITATAAVSAAAAAAGSSLR